MPLAGPARRGAADPGAQPPGRRLARGDATRARKLLAGQDRSTVVLDALSRGLTQKLLHGTALAELRAGDGEERAQTAEAVSRLFLRRTRATTTLQRPLAAGSALAPRARWREPFPLRASMKPQSASQFAQRLALRLPNSTACLAADLNMARHDRASRRPVARAGRPPAATLPLPATARSRPGSGPRDAGRPEWPRWRARKSPRRGRHRTPARLQTACCRVTPTTRSAFVEIRAGTGGDESALFAADLARMYLRFCERRAGAR